MGRSPTGKVASFVGQNLGLAVDKITYREKDTGIQECCELLLQNVS